MAEKKSSADPERPDLVSSDERYLLDKYNEVLKVRAAQVLGFFVAYSFALRAISSPFDNSSLLALLIPPAAFVLDAFVAKQFFQAPYAFELGRISFEKVSSKKGFTTGSADEISLVDIPIGLLVMDSMPKSGSPVLEFFLKHQSSSDRRSRFRGWYARQHAWGGFTLFGFFFIVALCVSVSKYSASSDARAG